MSPFSYIVTCHNSARLIREVVDGVMRSCGRARPVFVIDGCTDGTESVLRAHMQHRWGKSAYQLVATPDVHELLSINAGLSAVPQDDGYNIILQDDVILQEPNLESLIEELYAKVPQLGYVSLRLGVDFAHDDGSRAFIAEKNNLESVYGAGCTEDVLMPYEFAYRSMPIKSPVCLPSKLVRELGMFNPELAPYAYDDAEYSLRCAKAGYLQGVFAIPFVSDYRWGGTRKLGHPDILPTASRNCAYIRERWQSDINRIAAECDDDSRRNQRIRIRECNIAQMNTAMEQWHISRKLLADVEHGVIKLGADADERAFEMLHKNQGF